MREADLLLIQMFGNLLDWGKQNKKD